MIPIEPIVCSFDIRTKVKGKLTTKRVQRRQLPVSSTYAFTDYRAQGRTIPYVLVDLARPPSDRLSQFNLHVALSEISGRDTITPLWGFDDEFFLQPYKSPILEEKDRLKQMDFNTKGLCRKMSGGRM